MLAVVYGLGFLHGSFWPAVQQLGPYTAIAAAAELPAKGAERASAADASRRAAPSATPRVPEGRERADVWGQAADVWDQAIGPAAADSAARPKRRAAAGRAKRSGGGAPPSLARAGQPEKRVVAYSLYGARPKYCDGALRNAELVHSVFPGWTARFYVDASTVPAAVLAGLRERGAELVEVDTARLRDQHMFWRFWAAADPTVDRFVCRDTDSRLLPRDYAAVAEWVASGLPFHIERDHPSHSNYPISGGLWGGTREAVPDMLELIAAYPTDAAYLTDMAFLNDKIWPRARVASLQHDAFSCERFGARPFPLARSAEGEHVGQVLEEDGRPRQADVRLLLDAAAPLGCRHPDDALTPGNRLLDGLRAARTGSAARTAPPRRCAEMQLRYGIVPGSSWGDAPLSAQTAWAALSCDAALRSSEADASYAM